MVVVVIRETYKKLLSIKENLNSLYFAVCKIRTCRSFYICFPLVFFISILLGLSLGLSFTASSFIKSQGDIGKVKFSLPTRVYDLHDQLITEFFGDERRELVVYKDIPKHTIFALLAREDKDFFNHSGFSVRGTLRAVFKIFMLPFGGGFVSGGSTITQQLSGHLYARRIQDKSLIRKFRELWWSWQLEKYLSKEEILETYLNKMAFGHNTYGIQAASQYFYRNNVKEINAAESALLVIQLANPSGLYSPFRRPERAQRIQREILDQMVKNGYLSQDVAQKQHDEYWENHNWSRDGSSSAFFDRKDRAPWFSEYVRTELASLMPGKSDIHTGGYSVYTTIDLNYQDIAEEEIARGLEEANKNLRNNFSARHKNLSQTYLPYVDMISLLFSMDAARLPEGQLRRLSKESYEKDVNETLDLVSSLFSFQYANRASQFVNKNLIRRKKSRQIQTALLTLDQSTGYILAMVGGNRFDRFNQLNRAMSAKVMPGSAIKSLYFVEAIASKRLTAATNLANYPRYWNNEDGSIYTPLNYDGKYNTQGTLMRKALAKSLNIPSLFLLEEIGLDAAIARISQLMNVTDPMEISRMFPRVWALGLGVIGVSPLQMTRAYAVFPNKGKLVEPIAIRYVTDRNGHMVLDIENDIRMRIDHSDSSQLLTPETAYIMVDMLKSTVSSSYGTLWSAFLREGSEFRHPFAGKTGTSQNWSDAWAIGFTPYYTTTIWLGFDKGGYSLGPENEASSSTARTLIRYMKRIHKNLPIKKFTKPAGLVSVSVDSVTGLLPSKFTNSSILELFLKGTVPSAYSDGSVEQSVSGVMTKALIDEARKNRKNPFKQSIDRNKQFLLKRNSKPIESINPMTETGLIDLNFTDSIESEESEDLGLYTLDIDNPKEESIDLIELKSNLKEDDSSL